MTAGAVTRSHDGPARRALAREGRGHHETTEHAWTTSVAAAITRMHEQLGEPQELRDFARTALMSPFHFHRVFRLVTAAPPGKFLTALRMAQARRLLLETGLSATDISNMVGYSSFGTFTTQFTKLVGLSPGRFRSRATTVANLPVLELLESHQVRPSRVGRGPRGWVGPRPDDTPGLAVVGLFPSGIAQNQPLACGVAEPPDAVRLPEIDAQGKFEVLAVSVAAEATVGQVLTCHPKAGLFVGAAPQPVVLDRLAPPMPFWITLRRLVVTDPPLLLAFPLLPPGQKQPQPHTALL